MLQKKSEFEDIAVETTQNETQREINSTSELQGLQLTNTCVTGAPNGEEQGDRQVFK